MSKVKEWATDQKMWQLMLEEEKMVSHHNGMCEVLDYIKLLSTDHTLHWSEVATLNKVLEKFGYVVEHKGQTRITL